jgi:type I restriction enzyme S subunit
MKRVAEKYKQTEVGLIPSDWEVKEFVDVMDGFSSGQTPYRAVSEYYKGDIPWITSGELNYNIVTDTIEKITIDGAREANLKMIPKGTFLFAITGLEAAGTRGSCAITGIEATTNQSCMALYPKKGLLTTAYLYHYYVRYGNDLAFKYCQGTKQQSYTGAIAKKLPIIVPPTIEEQTAIATALSDADELINSLEKLIAKKRNIKQGAMQKLLKPKKGWEVKKLGDVLKIKHGKSQKEIEVKSGAYPILGTGGLMGFTNHFLYDKPSVLIGRKGTIDKPQYLDSPFWTVDTLFYTEIFNDFSAKYIYYIFNLVDWYSYNEASGVPSLNAKTIEKIERGFPSYEEQCQIATILSDMDEEIATLETKLEKYRKVKLGMMQNLLTGKIRLI